MQAIRIESAETQADVAAVRQLLTEYGPTLAVDLEYQGYAAELSGLPGAYAPPRGALLLARHGRRSVGCVALRPIDPETCEMKRLFVRAAYRSRGIGRRLVERIILEARHRRYRRMVLDSLPTMTEAIRLYRSLGFRDTLPYTFSPVEGTVFLELRLEEG